MGQRACPVVATTPSSRWLLGKGEEVPGCGEMLQGCWGTHPRGEGNSANTQPGSTTPAGARARGSANYHPSPSPLLGLEIRELLLISHRPRARGAPLSLLLTGEMSKPVVTVAP